MTIYEMLFREDIYGILENTLKEYYKKVFNEIVDVRVERSILKNYYVIYPRLGVAMARIPSASVLRDIYMQFNVQGNWMRKLIAWGYITFCVLTLGLLGSRTLYIGSEVYHDRKVYFMPCNRKIRVFNYRKGYVDAILKVGFNDNCFKKELKYRQQPEFGFIPGLLNYGDRWYRETIIRGSGLVRLPEPYYSEKVEEIKRLLKPFYESHKYITSAEEYCKKLSHIIESRIPILVNEKHIDTTDYLLEVVNHCLEVVSNKDENVPMVISHGDLQTGNILIEETSGKVYIYDWETAGERSVWYDMGRFMLYSQRRDKYAHMVNHRDEKPVKAALLTFDENKERNMDVVIATLVLEEIVAFIDEICDLPGQMGTEILDRLTEELKRTFLY